MTVAPIALTSFAVKATCSTTAYGPSALTVVGTGPRKARAFAESKRSSLDDRTRPAFSPGAGRDAV